MLKPGGQMKDIPNPQWLFCENRQAAHAAQNEMAKKVTLQDEIKQPIKYIGGMDVSNTPFDPKQLIFTSAVVCSYPSLMIVQTVTKRATQTFPYIPGLLGFREVPTLIEAFNQLSLLPDVIMVDGHGISHPRGLGVASHLGVLLDIPTIGVAKSILVGEPAGALSDEVGSTVSLMWKGKEIGVLMRTKKKCSPLIISSGHKISLTTATQLVAACLKKHRLPEPTRYAHIAANDCRRNFLGQK